MLRELQKAAGNFLRVACPIRFLYRLLCHMEGQAAWPNIRQSLRADVFPQLHGVVRWHDLQVLQETTPFWGIRKRVALGELSGGERTWAIAIYMFYKSEPFAIGPVQFS